MRVREVCHVCRVVRRARDQWLSKCICRDGEVRNLCELTFPALKLHRCVVGTETNGVLLNARPAELVALRTRRRAGAWGTS